MSMIIPSTLIIPGDEIPVTELPTGYKPLFKQPLKPRTIDFGRLAYEAYTHYDADTSVSDERIRGNCNRALQYLAQNFPGMFKIRPGKAIAVRDDDKILEHYGLSEIEYLRQIWYETPPYFQQWARNRDLYALAGAVWEEGTNHLLIPTLYLHEDDSSKPPTRFNSSPTIVYQSLTSRLEGYSVALRTGRD